MNSPAGYSTFQRRLDEVKTRIADMQGQMKDVHARINRLADRRLLERRAVVDPSRCTGCGICQDVCPQDAVRVTRVAAIDVTRCTGCGTCVMYCPQGAIRLLPDEHTIPRTSTEGRCTQ